MDAPVTRAAKGVTLRLDAIEIPSTVRPYNATAVVDLSRSIALIGLQSAPTVVEREGRYVLVAGRHRIEALRLLGVDSVLVRLVDMDDIEARLWAISENLHRAELTVLQRAEQLAEYAKLSNERREAQLRQVGAKPPGRPDVGNRAVARDFGISEQEVRRAKAIAALPEATKAAAEGFGLQDNQAALLAAVRAEEPDDQVAALKDIAARGSVAAARAPEAKLLRNLENLAAGELARWVKITTPNDRTHVIRVLRDAADILEDELNPRSVKGTTPMVDGNDDANPSIVDGELHNLKKITAGELVRWVRQTTPGTDVIRVLEEASAILQDELEAASMSDVRAIDEITVGARHRRAPAPTAETTVNPRTKTRTPPEALVPAARGGGVTFVLAPDRALFTLEWRGPYDRLIDEAVRDNYEAVLAWLRREAEGAP